jgi:hypothetical protein
MTGTIVLVRLIVVITVRWVGILHVMILVQRDVVGLGIPSGLILVPIDSTLALGLRTVHAAMAGETWE